MRSPSLPTLKVSVPKGALLAYAQESANTDNDGADLALAIENEIVDVADGLAGRVVNGLTDKYPGEPLVVWLLGDERHHRTGRARTLGQRLAGKWSCSQCQSPGQSHDLTSHRRSPSLFVFGAQPERGRLRLVPQLLGERGASRRVFERVDA